MPTVTTILYKMEHSIIPITLTATSPPVSSTEMPSYIMLILSATHEHIESTLFSIKRTPIMEKKNYDSIVAPC